MLIAPTGSDVWWWRAVKLHCFGAQTLVPLFQNTLFCVQNFISIDWKENIETPLWRMLLLM